MAGSARLGEGEAAVEEGHQLAGQPALVEGAPPGNVAGIAERQPGQQTVARLRVGAVGADQEVGLRLPPSASRSLTRPSDCAKAVTVAPAW